jgi:hypothetical protein
MLAFFDEGGEGVSFHDSDTTHTGGFRTNYSVDTKRIPQGNDDGDQPSTNVGGAGKSSSVTIVRGMPYVGWTDAGEWLCYTVNILETGVYDVDWFYSSLGDGTVIALSIDGANVSGNIAVLSTSYYHQWHEYTIIKGLRLEKGKRVLRFNVVSADGANLGYLTFKLVNNE